MKALAQHRRQAGLTLVELMISLVISAVVIGAAIQILLGSKQSYRMIEAMSRLQEDARYILDVIAVDLRMAGLNACGSDGSQANLLAGNTTDASLALFTTPVFGYENGTDFSFSGMPSSGVGSKVSGADILWFKSLDTRERFFVSNHNISTATITLNAASNFALGEIAMVCQPGHHAVFQVTSVNSAKTAIGHGFGSLTPGNCSQRLGAPAPTSCASGAGTPFTFDQIADVYRVNNMAYYIGVGADGSTPSLYRAHMRPNAAGTLSIAMDELVPGVEDMQLVYGEDTSSPPDQVIDVYRSASSVSDWDQVLAVRVNLVFRSADDHILDSPQSYTIEGTTVTPTDKRLRRVFSSTIGIRNRLP